MSDDTTQADVEEMRRIAEEAHIIGPGQGFSGKTLEEVNEKYDRWEASLGLTKDRATWSPDDVHITRGEQ